MIDLSVNGLDGVDSTGGRLGVDGALATGESPGGRLAAFFAEGLQTTERVP